MNWGRESATAERDCGEPAPSRGELKAQRNNLESRNERRRPLRFLLLNQAFYPDVVATGQHLADVAAGLAERGHQVTVVCSRRGYENPEKVFPTRETWRGVRIYRVGSTQFGKGSRWRRAVDFGSFLVCCTWRLAQLRRFDVVLALTSPPLISVLGAVVARLRGSRFHYWVMDFNPDEALAAGWLRPGSGPARLLECLSRFSLSSAKRVVALDRFMRDRIVAKGIDREKVSVRPPWSFDDVVRFDAEGRRKFRAKHGLEGRFVVMYAGNHSPCHPLATLLRAAECLKDDPSIVFCFVGGGSEWHKLRHHLDSQRSVRLVDKTAPISGLSTLNPQPSTNLLCLPYQPLEELAGSLSAADLHVVIMGDAFVGLVHPCKIYNILRVGAPVLSIGPRLSHLSEIARTARGEGTFLAAGHGEVDAAVSHILRVRDLNGQVSRRPSALIRSRFSREAALPAFLDELENCRPD